MKRLEPIEFSLKEIKAQIPKDCFKKSLPKSLAYMIRDLILLGTSFFTYEYFSSSWMGLFLYWNIYGFFMWCLFVVGHDCGHNSFSRHKVINAICGHLCHAPLLVPFFPWAYSHRKHHENHNHIHKDKSYPWLKKTEVGKFQEYSIRNFLSPFLIFGLYLYTGVDDGSHIFPLGKLYRNSGTREKLKCFISALSIISVLGIMYASFSSWSEFMLFYGGCWFVFCFWVFMVTYMHHHDEETVVFDESNWNFLSGALQTNDREYGFNIDSLHHHISDCHLVHHLFFTQIPHYHLKEATNAIIPFLGKHYKSKKHKIFIFDFWLDFFKLSFMKWTLAKEPKKLCEKE